MRPVENFQAKNGLKVDNDFGPNTAKVLKCTLRIISNEHAAHFIGQMAHESGNFTAGRENLNYSAQALANTWPDRYSVDPKAKIKAPNALALRIQRNPVAIANNCYANRMGNGDEASGDGWKNRGVGPLQLTGANNIAAFSKSVNDPRIIKNPDLILTDYYFESALFYFNVNKLWPICNQVNEESILKLSRAINIGNANSRKTPHGMKDRIDQTLKYYDYLRR